MERFHIPMAAWQDRLDLRWKQLPAQKKRRIVLYSFAGYVVITIAIVLQVIYEVGTPKGNVDIEHIINPVAKQDASAGEGGHNQEFKTQDNERE